MTQQSEAVPPFDWGGLSLLLAIYLPVLYLLLALIEASAHLWRPLPVFLYSVITLVSLLVMVAVVSDRYVEARAMFWDSFTEARNDVVRRYEEVRDPKAAEKRGRLTPITTDAARTQFRPEAVAFMGASVIAVIVAFSEMCRHLSFYFGGFVSDQSGYWHWLRFGVSWVADNALFNSSQILEWHISEIQANEPWSRALVIAFNIVLEAVVVAAVLVTYRFARGGQTDLRRTFYASYSAFIRTHVIGIVPLAMWGIPTIVFVTSVISDKLTQQSAISSILLASSILVGAWLVLQHVLALLAVTGPLNKLIAVLGIAAGVGVLYISYSVVFANLHF